MKSEQTTLLIAAAVIIIGIVLTITLQLGSAFEKEITIAKKYTAIGGVRYAYTKYMIVATDGNIPLTLNSKPTPGGRELCVTPVALHWACNPVQTVYQVSNVWWRADFNNEEDWHALDIGKTYRVKGWGYRVPLFGMYPNIYKIVN